MVSGAVLLFAMMLSGCNKVPASHDIHLLDDMARYACMADHPALWTSDAGLIACLVPSHGESWHDSPSMPEYTENEGVYWNYYKLLAGWEWIFLNDDLELCPGEESVIRPDYLERSLTPEVSERIVVHPDAPVMMIEFTRRSPSEVYYIPRFDLVNLMNESDPQRGELVLFDDGFVFELDHGCYLSISTNGQMIHQYEEMLDCRIIDRLGNETSSAHSHWNPGRVFFDRGQRVRIGLAMGRNIEEARQRSMLAVNNSSRLKEKAESRVLEYLDLAPMISDDLEFMSVAAWDRWRLRSHRIRGRFVSRPPMHRNSGPFENAQAATAWYWSTASDTIHPELIASVIDEISNIGRVHHEQFSRSMGAIQDYMEITGDYDELEPVAPDVIEAFVYFDNFYQSESRSIGSQYNRWGERLLADGIEVPSDLLNKGVQFQFATVVGRTTNWETHITGWRQGMREVRRNQSEHQSLQGVIDEIDNGEGYLPNHMTETYPVWFSRENRYINLAHSERILLANRYASRATIIAEAASQLWRTPYGYRFHQDLDFGTLVYSAPGWHMRWKLAYEHEESANEILQDYFVNAPAEYYRFSVYDGSIPRPVGSPEDLETIAARIRFLYETMLGIRPDPENNRIYIAPAGNLEFWRGRAVQTQVEFNGEVLGIYMDPYEGDYRITRSNPYSMDDFLATDGLTLILQDIWILDHSLSLDVGLEKHGTTHLQRVLENDLPSGYLLNGTSVRTTEERHR